MNATGRGTAAGQGDINGFALQAAIQLGIGERLAAFGQQGFNAFLGGIDARAFGLAFCVFELAKAFQEFGQHAALAEVARFFVFQRSAVAGKAEAFRGLGHELFEIGHRSLVETPA
jgi:hypothetical protein